MSADGGWPLRAACKLTSCEGCWKLFKHEFRRNALTKMRILALEGDIRGGGNPPLLCSQIHFLNAPNDVSVLLFSPQFGFQSLSGDLSSFLRLQKLSRSVLAFIVFSDFAGTRPCNSFSYSPIQANINPAIRSGTVFELQMDRRLFPD